MDMHSNQKPQRLTHSFREQAHSHTFRVALTCNAAYISRLALSTPPSAERAAPKTLTLYLISTTPNLKAEKVCTRRSYVATPRILVH